MNCQHTRFLINRLKCVDFCLKSKADNHTVHKRKIFLSGASFKNGSNKLSVCESNCFVAKDRKCEHGRTIQPVNLYTISHDKSNGIINKNQLVCGKTDMNIRSFHQDTSKQKEGIVKSSFLSAGGIVEASPTPIQPYLKLIRFDRPIGTWLLFLPCTWSISLATPAGCLPDPTILALFASGAFLMRGAGCIINDMWDKDFDSKVERTRNRPLASGQISQFQALSFLALQLSASLAILLTFDWSTVILGASSMALVIVYPLMKRFTYWPQAVLGMTFNWGALLGWSATAGSVAWYPALSLYAACQAWTMVYDTIYAHQDKEDDILIGVKSTALKFGDQTKPWLTGFSSLMVAGLTCTGLLCEQTWPYYTGVGVIALHLAHQIYTVDLSNPEDCGKTFRSNRNLGVFFWLCIMTGTMLKTGEQPHKDTESTDSSS